ncbi:MAG: class II aldolase/adducin family protein, partial [Ilumatobacteraceae bacterium]
MALTDQPIISFHPEPADDPEVERVNRKAKLAGALRIFGRLGFGEGVAGHITV